MQFKESARGSKGIRVWAIGEIGRLGDSGNLLTLLIADAPLDARPSSSFRARGETVGRRTPCKAPRASLGCEPAFVGWLMNQISSQRLC
jgi:hypothetical protein